MVESTNLLDRRIAPVYGRAVKTAQDYTFQTLEEFLEWSETEDAKYHSIEWWLASDDIMKWVIKAARNNLVFFASFFMPLYQKAEIEFAESPLSGKNAPDIHKTAGAYLLSQLYTGKPRMLGMLWARGRGKSHMSRATTAHGMIFGLKKFQVMLVSNPRNLSSRLSDIKNTFENNNIIKKVFGDMCGKGVYKWSNEEAKIVTRATPYWTASDYSIFQLITTKSQNRGLAEGAYRPNRLIIDDADDDDTAASKTETDALFRLFRTVLIPGLEPDSVIDVLGTTVSTNGLTSYLCGWKIRDINGEVTVVKPPYYAGRDIDPDEYVLLDFPAIEELKPGALPSGDIANLRSTWEDKYPLSVMLHSKDGYYDCKKNHELGYFHREYQNEIVTEEGGKYFSYSYFREYVPNDTWFKREGENKIYFKQGNKLSNVNFYMILDIASSKRRTADFQMIEVWGVNADRQFFLADISKTRGLGQEEFTRVLIEQALKWNVLKICVPTNTSGDAINFLETCKKIMDKEYPNLSRKIHEIQCKHYADMKDKVIMATKPIAAQNRIFLPTVLESAQKTRDVQDLLQNWLQYQGKDSTSYDDDIDAAGMLFYYCWNERRNNGVMRAPMPEQTQYEKRRYNLFQKQPKPFKEWGL